MPGAPPRLFFVGGVALPLTFVLGAYSSRPDEHCSGCWLLLLMLVLSIYGVYKNVF